MFDLTGMTALVTGASGGIGSAIARALAGQGARLALSGSNSSKLRSFREELNEEFGNDHVEITCDLSNTTQVEELVPAAKDIRIVFRRSRAIPARSGQTGGAQLGLDEDR